MLHPYIFKKIQHELQLFFRGVVICFDPFRKCWEVSLNWILSISRIFFHASLMGVFGFRSLISFFQDSVFLYLIILLDWALFFFLINVVWDCFCFFYICWVLFIILYSISTFIRPPRKRIFSGHNIVFLIALWVASVMNNVNCFTIISMSFEFNLLLIIF
jgi:hypothetical protein